jgi:hypothetical protein
MSALAVELGAYSQQETRLELSYRGKWVVFKGTTLVGVYESFDAAAEEAVAKFGRGPYLIRQVGAPPIVMPVSVAYSPENEKH